MRRTTDIAIVQLRAVTRPLFERWLIVLNTIAAAASDRLRGERRAVNTANLQYSGTSRRGWADVHVQDAADGPEEQPVLGSQETPEGRPSSRASLGSVSAGGAPDVSAIWGM
jgi:hypothetical protein